VEFGLIDTAAGLRTYGAGLLSSAAELRHSVTSPVPLRISFDLARIMLTRYKIAEPAAAAPLDLKSLETRLRQTQVIGVFAKLALKNQDRH
jgi:phenylalanine-4-hydroxylase